MTNNPSIKKNKAVQKLVKSIVGEEGFSIIDHLFEVKKADEFEIAESLKEDVNFVRSVMYKMYTNNLVTYTRRRDPERGWYIYTWELTPKKVYNILIDLKQKKLDNLFKKMEGEQTKQQAFKCPTCNIKLEFPKALELNFGCFACGKRLEPLNNEELIKELNSKIKDLSESIGLLQNKLNEL